MNIIPSIFQKPQVIVLNSFAKLLEVIASDRVKFFDS